MLQLVPGRPRSEWAVASSGSVDPVAGAAALWGGSSGRSVFAGMGCGVRRMHGPPEDLLDWGRPRVSVVFPPQRDSHSKRSRDFAEAWTARDARRVESDMGRFGCLLAAVWVTTGVDVVKLNAFTGRVMRPYNTHRPHRSLNLAPPELSEQKAHAMCPSPTATVERRDWLGGLIHEYNIAA
jgi:hypothetical protein